MLYAHNDIIHLFFLRKKEKGDYFSGYTNRIMSIGFK